MLNAGNPRVTPEVTRDVCLLARLMAANLYYSQIEELMFEVDRISPTYFPFASSIFTSEEGFIKSATVCLIAFPFSLQLSMWRCTDELRSRAEELHRNSRRDAKHYIGISLMLASLILFLYFECKLSAGSDKALRILDLFWLQNSGNKFLQLNLIVLFLEM